MRFSRLLLAIVALLALAILVPITSSGWGGLEDVRYKIKGVDGNRWEELLGRGGIVRGDEAKGKLTFTFDDGPDHRTTPLILDVLDRHRIKGTFFVNGHRFHPRTAGGIDNQGVLREIYRRGHHIGNHTFSHKDITTLDERSWRLEVLQVAQLVKGVTGRRPRLFRPPFGAGDTKSFTHLSRDGYTVVMWNLDPLDWKAASALDLLDRTKRVIEENPDGGILLFHDTNRTTAQALPLIIEWIGERNALLSAQGRSILEIVGIEHFIRK